MVSRKNVLFIIPCICHKALCSTYTLETVTVGDSTSSAQLLVNELIHVQWTVDNQVAALNDTCYMAVRSKVNDTDPEAYVVDLHWPCGFPSVNILVPKTPHDTSLKYDDTEYFVRLISPAPNNVELNSASFQLRPANYQAPNPWQRADWIGLWGLVVAIISAFVAIWSAWASGRRQEAPLAPPSDGAGKDSDVELGSPHQNHTK